MTLAVYTANNADSSISKVTCYRLDNQGSFQSCPHRLLGPRPTQPPIPWLPSVFKVK